MSVVGVVSRLATFRQPNWVELV